jgi:hypothetical protein
MLDSRANKYFHPRAKKTCPHTPESCDPAAAAASRVSIHIREIIYSPKVVTSYEKARHIRQSKAKSEIEKKVGGIFQITHDRE